MDLPPRIAGRESGGIHPDEERGDPGCRTGRKGRGGDAIYIMIMVMLTAVPWGLGGDVSYLVCSVNIISDVMLYYLIGYRGHMYPNIFYQGRRTYMIYTTYFHVVSTAPEYRGA